MKAFEIIKKELEKLQGDIFLNKVNNDEIIDRIEQILFIIKW